MMSWVSRRPMSRPLLGWEAVDTDRCAGEGFMLDEDEDVAGAGPEAAEDGLVPPEVAWLPISHAPAPVRRESCWSVRRMQLRRPESDSR